MNMRMVLKGLPPGVIAAIAVALLLRGSLACAAPAGYGVDCSPASWPPRTTPNVFELALTAEQEAAAGDPAAADRSRCAAESWRHKSGAEFRCH
jgi:hypothetical protein